MPRVDGLRSSSGSGLRSLYDLGRMLDTIRWGQVGRLPEDYDRNCVLGEAFFNPALSKGKPVVGIARGATGRFVSLNPASAFPS